MKIENIEVYGFRAAFRGMRNPLDSWDKSDSMFNCYETRWGDEWYILSPELDRYAIGKDDLKLACRLIKNTSEHRKFLRHIQVWFDITAPIYIWSEKDTYKIATVRNSCSTMHTLGLRDLTQEDFELGCDEECLNKLNKYGENFRQAKKEKDIKKMNEIRHKYKNDLPSGFLQKATYMMSYETALNMYFQRRNHKLPEWNLSNPNSICSFIAALPYMKEFIEARER